MLAELFFHHQVIIELITGWVLGKGPCGNLCNKGDIGRSTNTTRPSMISANPDYLGTFSKEYKTVKHPFQIVDFNETVIAMSEHGKWEQEIMHFSVIMKKDEEKIDIAYVLVCYE